MQKIKERLFGAVVFLALGVIFVPMFFSENNKKIHLTDMQMKEPVVSGVLTPISEPENLVILNQLEKPSFDGTVMQPYQDMEDLALHESPNSEDTTTQNISNESLEASSKATQQMVAQNDMIFPLPAVFATDTSSAMTPDMNSDIQGNTAQAAENQKNTNDLLQQGDKSTQPVLKQVKNSIKTKPESSTPSKKARITEVSAAWVVQLATFKEGTNADSLVKNLQRDGYPAYSKLMQNSQGTYTLVLVGPKVAKAEADSLKVELKTKYRLQGVVIQHQPISS